MQDEDAGAVIDFYGNYARINKYPGDCLVEETHSVKTRKDKIIGKFTDQTQPWSAEFGKGYTDRNPHTIEVMDGLYKKQFGLTRTALNLTFLDNFDRSIKILEVGANVGSQLQGLQGIGFENLYGIELQPYAVEASKQNTKNINLTP